MGSRPVDAYRCEHLRRQGWSYRAIAEEYGVDPTVIRTAVENRTQPPPPPPMPPPVTVERIGGGVAGVLIALLFAVLEAGVFALGYYFGGL